MTPTERADRSARDADIRDRILAAARRLIEDAGIDAVNMYQIAQEAGIGQGTLYRRFSHPGEIYSELFRASAEAHVQSLEEELARENASATPALEQLDRTIRRLIDYIDDNLDLVYAISCSYAVKNQVASYKRPVMTKLRACLIEILERALRQGETPNMDSTLTAGFIIACLDPRHYERMLRTNGYTKAQIQDSLCRLFIQGLRVSKP